MHECFSPWLQCSSRCTRVQYRFHIALMRFHLVYRGESDKIWHGAFATPLKSVDLVYDLGQMSAVESWAGNRLFI